MWPVDDIFVLPACQASAINDTSFVVPRHSLSSYGRRAFTVAGPTAWNSLSDDLRDPKLSTYSFRRLLKIRLFSVYYYAHGIALYALYKCKTYLLTYLHQLESEYC